MCYKDSIAFSFYLTPPQQTFTCSKSTIETQKMVGDMFKLNNEDTRITTFTSLWCLYC